MNEKDRSPEGVSDNALSTEASRAEQRKYRRFPSELGVRIHWKDASGSLQNTSGIIIDVSAGGFGIELARPFPTGTLLSVETQEGSLQCVVRHAQERPTSCRLGVEVLAASDGSNHRLSLDNLEIALAESKKSGPK
jgi:hypothetical protein